VAFSYRTNSTGLNGATVAPATSGAAALKMGWWPEAIWALGTLAVVARMAWARLLLGGFRRRCHEVRDAALLGRVQRLAARLGLRRPVRVLAAERLAAPVVFGSFRPAIALPTGFARDFDAGQQEAVLAHELAHLAAGDPGWHFLAGLVCACLWWQPLVWWSRRQLRAASEAVADEASLLVPDGPGLLAASLVAVGRRLLRSRRLGWISIEGNGFRSGLGQRVERLLELRPQPWRAPHRGRLVLVKTTLTAALACVAISCTAWAQSQVPSIKGGTTMSVLKTSWRCSLAATALWAMLGSNPAVADNGSAADKDKPATPEKSASDQGATRRGDQAAATRSTAPSPQQMEQRRKLYEQMKALHQQIEGLKDGQDSQRQELKAKMQKLYEQLRELPPPPNTTRSGGAPYAGGRGELDQKIAHLRTAAENLRAAGMGDKADEILRTIERMQAAPRDGGRPRYEPGARTGGAAPSGTPTYATTAPGRYTGTSPREIQELRSQVEQMRHDVREMHEQLKRLLEQQHGDRK
jgi:beta-lactamase regulating signal transducer with metallopeptidase domain